MDSSRLDQRLLCSQDAARSFGNHAFMVGHYLYLLADSRASTKEIFFSDKPCLVQHVVFHGSDYCWQIFHLVEKVLLSNGCDICKFSVL